MSVSLESADLAALASLGCGLRLTQARAMIGGKLPTYCDLWDEVDPDTVGKYTGVAYE